MSTEYCTNVLSRYTQTSSEQKVGAHLTGSRVFGPDCFQNYR